MEQATELLSSLVTGIRRVLVDGGITSSAIDSLLTLAERLLRVFVLLLAADVSLIDNVRIMQNVVNNLERVLHALSANEISDNYSYYSHLQFSGERGRPRLDITQPMLEYFFGHGFSASTTARLLHVSLRTLRRRMSEFGMMMRSQYSDITNEKLDMLITSIQDQYPNCGYRMMQGHLRALNHHVQQSQIREAMLRTDPQGIISRWCNTVVRRIYSVRSPNSLWHIDGNHRLIR